MGRHFLLVTISTILLAGCDAGASPEARRGDAQVVSPEPAPAAETSVDAAESAAAEPAAAETATTAAAPQGATESDGAKSRAAQPQEGGPLNAQALTFKVPEGWQRKAPSSSFVLAELSLPKVEGDEMDGRLTVSVAGGSVEANIQRWRDQFGGKPESASEKRKMVNGLEVTLVDFSGEFNDQRGPFAPATKRAGYRMLAAIIPVDGELHFVKAVGPQATMTAHAERFSEFIDSVAKK